MLGLSHIHALAFSNYLGNSRHIKGLLKAEGETGNGNGVKLMLMKAFHFLCYILRSECSSLCEMENNSV